MTLQASKVLRAPGKLILIGEYAVLDGAAAVVLAVNRYVKLYFRSDMESEASLVVSARRKAAELLDVSLSGRTYTADSSAFFRDGLKLGLGSSAAVAACAAASVFCEAGYDIGRGAVRRRVFEAAKAAHDAFQGTRGSGVDVAASVFGGLKEMRGGGDPSAPVISDWRLPRGLALAYYWSGAAASTPKLLAAVRRFKERRAVAYDRIIDDMRLAGETFVSARSAGDAVEALRRYGMLMENLGAAAGVSIVTGPMAALSALADRLGGAAKPSGAGGGDMVLAAFLGDVIPEDFDSEAIGLGFRPIPLDIAEEGLCVVGEKARGPSNPDR